MVAYGVAALFVAIRFGPFAHASVRGHVRAFEEWRVKARALGEHARREGTVIHLKDPALDGVAPMYVEPMFRWEERDYETAVIVDRRGP